MKPLANYSVVPETQECQPTLGKHPRSDHPCLDWRHGTLPLPSQGSTRNSGCKVSAKALWYLEDWAELRPPESVGG